MKHVLMILLLISCGKPLTTKEANETRNPQYEGVSENILFDTSMSFNFKFLPLKGEVRKGSRFWSGDSWRHQKGSINYRWNSPLQEGFGYVSPTQREISTYPIELMKQLSPAEKYDLYMGRYDYPLRWEVDFFARSGQESWEGICHGWAGASANHDDPKPKTVTNPDGIEIHFGSSDIKALLSYAYSKILIREQDSLGKRCEEENFLNDENCDNDLSPESFHAVLANKLGLRGQTIIADMDRYKEVWNRPVTKYESFVEQMIGTREGKKAIIKTKMTYVDVVLKNSWNPHPPVTSIMTTRYELYLDKGGNITGGKWLSKERPDFLWAINKSDKFEGYLSQLMSLLK